MHAATRAHCNRSEADPSLRRRFMARRCSPDQQAGHEQGPKPGLKWMNPWTCSETPQTLQERMPRLIPRPCQPSKLASKSRRTRNGKHITFRHSVHLVLFLEPDEQGHVHLRPAACQEAHGVRDPRERFCRKDCALLQGFGATRQSVLVRVFGPGWLMSQNLGPTRQ